MPKCAKCNQDATCHVTEVYEGTGEVKEYHLWPNMLAISAVTSALSRAARLAAAPR